MTICQYDTTYYIQSVCSLYLKWFYWLKLYVRYISLRLGIDPKLSLVEFWVSEIYLCDAFPSVLVLTRIFFFFFQYVHFRYVQIKRKIWNSRIEKNLLIILSYMFVKQDFFFKLRVIYWNNTMGFIYFLHIIFLHD